MQRIKKIIKKALKIDHTSYLKPLKKVQYIGWHYHGYYIPENLLNENPVCYCVGAGEDLTCDTELVVNYNAKVFIFDPAPEGINHFAKLNTMVINGETLSVGSTPFTYRISAPQLDKITYIETGVWSEKTLRVAIARAIVADPAVLLADEPTGNLDTVRRQEIMDLLWALNVDHGITVLMVTHEPDMAAYARRIIRCVDGMVASDTINPQPAGQKKASA